MKITFVTPADDLTGGIRVIAIYAKALLARGHAVEVVSNAPDRFTPRLQLRALLHGTWRSTRQAFKVRPGHIAYSGVPHRVLERPRAVVASDVPDADVVIATWWLTADWVAALPPAKGIKVHFMQDYETFGGAKELVDATCRLPWPRITPSKWVKELLVSEFGCKDVALAPNAVDLNIFNAMPRGKRPVPTVGFTYTSFVNKGCDITIEAIRLARQKRPELKVTCFGSTPPIPSLPLPLNTEFKLWIPDNMLKDQYAACDAWLFGTRKEGFGLPILEAMACRTPVIGTPAGAAPELLSQGGGILVKPEDPASMAHAILKVCDMKEDKWRAMSDKAYATVSNYTWDDATYIFEQALQRALAR